MSKTLSELPEAHFDELKAHLDEPGRENPNLTALMVNSEKTIHRLTIEDAAAFAADAVAPQCPTPKAIEAARRFAQRAKAPDHL